MARINIWWYRSSTVFGARPVRYGTGGGGGGGTPTVRHATGNTNFQYGPWALEEFRKSSKTPPTGMYP